MEWSHLALAGSALALVGLVALRAVGYRRLFADAHFAEVAWAVARIKAAALDADEGVAGAEPRALVTSRGLALAYTVAREGGGYVHHYSVGLAGRPTPSAVGETFALFVAHVLGVPFAVPDFGVASSTVHHAGFRLPADAHAAFAARPVWEATAAELGTFRQAWAEARGRLRWRALAAGEG